MDLETAREDVLHLVAPFSGEGARRVQEVRQRPGKLTELQPGGDVGLRRVAGLAVGGDAREELDEYSCRRGTHEGGARERVELRRRDLGVLAILLDPEHSASGSEWWVSRDVVGLALVYELLEARGRAGLDDLEDLGLVVGVARRGDGDASEHNS